MNRRAILGISAVILLGVVLLAARGLLLSDTPGSTVVSPEAAAAAEQKLAELTTLGVEIRPDSGELTSLLRYRPDLWAETPVLDPTVTIASDTVTLTGAVAAADLPAEPELEAFRYLLPETTQVAISGTLATEVAESVTLHVASIEVAGMPVPPRFYPVVLSRLGPEFHRPPDGIALPLPAVIGQARVEDSELVLSP